MAHQTNSPTIYLGAVVSDERPNGDVPIKIGFTTVGSGGTLQVAQTSTLFTGFSESVASNNVNFVTAVNEFGQTPAQAGITGNVVSPAFNASINGFPLEKFLQSLTYNERLAYATSTASTGAKGQVSYGGHTFPNGSGELFYACNFTQPRNSKRFYYARRVTNLAAAHPNPVSENVPGKPVISSVTHNSSGSGATVVLSSNPTNSAIGANVYYTSASFPYPEPLYKDDFSSSGAGFSSPPNHWTNNPVFSTSAGKRRYYWALGRTDNNPGVDGAVISPVFKARSVPSGSGNEEYGFEIYGAGGEVAFSNVDAPGRLYYRSGDVSVGKGSATSSSPTGNSITLSVPGLPDGSTNPVSAGGFRWFTYVQILNRELTHNATISRNNNTDEIVLTYTAGAAQIAGSSVTLPSILPAVIKFQVFVFRI